jgi:FkbM family methyltransferase
LKKKIIYDIGSNNGDDIPYYLLKSDLIIAIEANPELCSLINNRFKNEIVKGKLIVENCVLQDDISLNHVSFYIHKKNHVLSQFPKPLKINDFNEIKLPSKNIVEIIKKYGTPYYIKIDIEHVDHLILKEILNNNIIPPYISCESHSVEVFATLISSENYKSFKLVDGASVSKKYQNHEIITDNGKKKYSFPHHSAGPFGNDISGPWMTSHNFFQLLGFVGLGWKDIHATNIDEPDKDYRVKPHVEISVKY